jgi:hypothetical protein
MSRRALATMLVFLLTGIPLPARPAGTPNVLPLGIVTQASGAHFNAAKASAGATIYDGDALSTEADGTLQFRAPAAVLYLPGTSGVTLYGLPNGTQAQLQTGTVVFSTPKSAAMEILAQEALVRPAADGPTVGQVTVLGPKELQISARRGTLEFSYAGQTERLAEGASYRIFLDQTEATSWPQPQRPPPKSGREDKKFKIIVIGFIAGVTALAFREAFESPDRP